MKFRAVWFGLLFAMAARASPIPVQVTGIENGFTIGCAGNGCGGKFDAELGGAVNSSGNLAGGEMVFVYCIDAQNSVYIPSPVYDANLTSLANGPDLSTTRFGRSSSQWDDAGDPSSPIAFRTAAFTIGATDSLTPTALERYDMEAWLVSQYSTLPKSDRAAVQDAIWQVTDAMPPQNELANYIAPPYPGGATGAEIQTLLSGAAQFVKYDGSGAFYSQFQIVTNAGPLYLEGQEPAQELMVWTPVPEPVSFAGAIAALLGSLVWLRRRQAASAGGIGARLR